MTTNLRPPTPDARLPPAPSPLPVLHALHGEKASPLGALAAWRETPFLRGKKKPPSASRNGVALLITLGLLTVLAMLVIGFTLSVRWDRLSARNYRDRVAAGHLFPVAVGLAMDFIEDSMALGTGEGEDYIRVGGRLYPSGNVNAGWWFEPHPVYAQSRSCLSYCPPGEKKPIRLFNITRSVTSMVPASLWSEAETVESGWIYISSTNELSKSNLATTNGRVASLILDVSGFLDVHALRTNEFEVLPESAAAWPTFFKDRETHRRYYSLPDIAANDAIDPPISNLFWTSFDPGPEVYWTNWSRLGTRQVELLNRFPVNEITNYSSRGTFYSENLLHPPLQVGTALRAVRGRFRETSLPGIANRKVLQEPPENFNFREKYFLPLTNHLARAGFSDVNEIGWNLVNALDEDRIPQTDHATPWRDPYGFEAVPLINEFALFEVESKISGHDPEIPAGMDRSKIDPAESTNHYALAVELWYPFAPNPWEDEAELVVGVFTNRDDYAAFVEADDADLLGGSQAEIGDFGFIASISDRPFDSNHEYKMFLSPPEEKYVNFRVKIRRFEWINPEGETPGYWNEVDPGTEYLPLGAFEYDRNVSVTEGVPYPDPQPVTGINEVFFQSRVRMKEESGTWRWVDEAFSDEIDATAATLVAFTNTVSLSIDDPLRNARYPGTGTSEWLNRADFSMSTLGGMNTNCTATTWGNSFGLPLRHVDGPFTHPKHIGWVASTNAWTCIDFTTPEGARLLDIFTVGETNAPARGRVNVGTPHPAVIRALLADAVIGWPERRLDSNELDTLTDAFFEGRKTLDDTLLGALSFGGITLDSESGPYAYPGLMTAIAQFDPYGYYQTWRPHPDGLPAAGMKQDVLAHLADRLSFRQQIYVIVTAAQTLSPRLRVTAEQRAVAVILRDAYTGRWQILRRHRLPE